MTHYNRVIFFTAALLAATAIASADDAPCWPKATEYDGYVCICNETYCDTVETPTELASGQFYWYVTSNISPGFTKTINNFTSTTQFDPESEYDEDDDVDLSSVVKVWVNASITYQTYKGVGMAVTDTSATLINELNSGTIDNIMETLFGSTGVEYNFYRMPVASSDYSESYYTQDDVDGDIDLTYWNLTSQDINLKIPFYKKALAASSRGLKLLVSPWSAPGWMKTSGSYLQGYLLNSYYEAWAKYLLKFLKAYKDEGVDIWGMTIGNEVILALYFGPDFEMGNMIMLPAQQRYWVKKYLGPMIRASEFKDIKLYALDDERPFLSWAADRLFTDSEYYKYIDGVSIHWYFDWNTTTSMLDTFHTQYPEKSIIYAETCINDQQSYNSEDVIDLGNWVDAVRYVYNIFENLCHWSETYIDWTVALNRKGGPVGLDGYYLDAQLVINTTSNEFYKQPLYYILGHFSKFMAPGSQRINVKVKQESNDTYDEQCSTSSQTVNLNKRKSFKDMTADKPSLTLPTLAPMAASTAVRVLTTLNEDGSRTVFVYNPRSEAAKLTVTDTEKGTFKATVTSKSLNTFIYW